jgi:hypothetical protein
MLSGFESRPVHQISRLESVAIWPLLVAVTIVSRHSPSKGKVGLSAFQFHQHRTIHRPNRPATSTQPPGAATAGDLRPDQTERHHEPPDASNPPMYDNGQVRIEMDYEKYTAAIQALLNDINALGLDLELRPGWSYPIMDARTVSFGYKLHRKTGPTRTMSVTVHEFSGFIQQPDGSITLSPSAKEQIHSAVADFWRDGNMERHTFVDVH